MHITSIDQVDQLRSGLGQVQQEQVFAAYGRAYAAFQIAGFPEDQCHDQASAIALSRIDEQLELVAVCDALYDGTWPTPGKGAPRNPYGGFASLGFGGKGMAHRAARLRTPHLEPLARVFSEWEEKKRGGPFEKGLPSRSPPKLFVDASLLRSATSHGPSRLHAAIVQRTTTLKTIGWSSHIILSILCILSKKA